MRRCERMGAVRRLTRAFAVFVVLSVVPGCSEEPPAVSAAKAYAAAVQSGDAKRVLSLVDESTASFFDQAAARASDQIGGRRSVEPHEMLQVVDVDPRFQVAKAELVSSTETTATVKLLGAEGSEHVVHLVLEDEQWKVHVPMGAASQVGS